MNLDEAFLPFSSMLEKMLSIEGEILDDGNGIHSYIYALDIGTPIELDITRDENGRLMLGTIPPMYRVETSLRPSFHSISFVAEKINYKEDGDTEHILEP